MAWFRKQLMLLTILGVMSTATAYAQEDEEAVATEKSGEDSASKAKKKKDKDKKKGPPLYYASLGLGKTLPEGFYRIRSVNRFATGTAGYDSNGKKDDFGYGLTANVNALVLEYGMSDRFSFLLLAPIITKNNVAFNKRQFKTSPKYTDALAKNQEAFKNKVAGNLLLAGVCPSPAACSAFVESAINDPSKDFSTAWPPITLPSGESVSIPAGTSIKTIYNEALPDLVTKAGTPADGATGLGDVDFGINYSLVATRTNVFAIGVGVRMPFGKFEDVTAAQRPTGEGYIQLGIRLNYDYHPWAPLWLSFQNQSEIMIVEGKRKKSSLLDPNKLNTGDPTTDAAIDAGSDGDPNSQTVTRKGVGQVGLIRADFGLAKLTPVLQPMSVETALNYKFGAAEYYGSRQVTPGEQKRSISYGFKFDGLGLDRPYPAYIRVTREKFLSGKNVPIATDSFSVEFAIYESF